MEQQHNPIKHKFDDGDMPYIARPKDTTTSTCP